jgi:SNF2 family DNA or RNA helicase
LYSALDASIAVAILDESQTIKNDDAMVTKSVCSLNYHYAFALTGTPLFNQWKDITGQLMAFPGYPFKNTKHFLSIFGEGQSIRGTALNDLKNFLASMMVARPKDVLKKALKEHIITDVKVILDDPMVLMRIAKDVKNAKWFLSEAGSKSTSDPKEAANLRLSGYAALTKAQCRSACPALLRGRDNIPDEIFVLMRDDDDSSTAGTEEEGVEKLLRLGEPADNDIPEAIDGEDDGEEADPTYNPDVGDVDLLDNTIIEDDEDDDMDSNERRELYRALPPQKRGEWLKELYSMPEAKISSPRVTTIINLIRDILRDFPGEKIVIVSRFVKFLDVLQLNIANQSVTEATEFNGFVPQDQRNENLRQFNRENGGPMVLLLSANAGGTGLNITRASHSILCEPQWSSGAVIQIRGRNVRLGQTRVVRSYNILVECSIDVHLKKLLEKKEVSNNSLMGDIVRPDNEPWFKDMAVDSPSAEAASPEAAEAVSPEAAEAASPEAAEAASQADCPSLDAEEVDSDTSMCSPDTLDSIVTLTHTFCLEYRRQQEQADLISNITEWLGIRAYGKSLSPNEKRSLHVTNSSQTMQSSTAAATLGTNGQWK